MSIKFSLLVDPLNLSSTCCNLYEIAFSYQLNDAMYFLSNCSVPSTEVYISKAIRNENLFPKRFEEIFLRQMVCVRNYLLRYWSTFT